MNDLKFELEQSGGEAEYIAGKLQEALDLLQLLSDEQLDALIAACEVEFRERDVQRYSEDLPF